MRVVATAGHVDHGKSTLVLALTGTDPDRFAEEKARGLTIDLGFAFTTLAVGHRGRLRRRARTRAVPQEHARGRRRGRRRAARGRRRSEGWMPQSEEHLRDPRAARRAARPRRAHEGRHRSTPTTLELGAARGRRSGCRGRRSVTLRSSRATRSRVAGSTTCAPRSTPCWRRRRPPRDVDRPRLWVDRVFAPRGAGTVVTGTLVGGAVAVGDVLEVGGTGDPGAGARHRDRPPARRARRAGHACRAEPRRSRARRRSQRGDALVRPGQWTATTVVDVARRRSRPGSSSHGRARLQAYVGSGEHEVSCHALDDDGAFARLRFATPIPLAPGDRVVLRDAGRECTVAGAEVLDVEPTGAARDAAAAPRVAARGAAPRRAPGACSSSTSPRLTGLSDAGGRRARPRRWSTSGTAVRVGDSLVDVSWLTRPPRPALASTCAATAGVDLATLAGSLGVDTGDLRAMLEDDDAARRGTRDRARRHAGADRRVARGASRSSPRSTRRRSRRRNPRRSEPTPRSSRALVRHGALVDIGGVVFTVSAVDRARELVREHLTTHDTITVGDVRDLLGSSRKYVVPLLEHFDREGVTRRRGDVRIAGPTHRHEPASTNA